MTGRLSLITVGGQSRLVDLRSNTSNAPVFHRTVNDMVYDKFGAPLRTTVDLTRGKHEQPLGIAGTNYDWWEGSIGKVEGPFPQTYNGLTYSYHNVWVQTVPWQGGVPVAHRDVRIQVDAPQVWHLLTDNTWVNKSEDTAASGLSGGYWNGDGTGFTRTTAWPSTEPNIYWRTEATGGISFDTMPMTNADGSVKQNTSIGHFGWSTYFPRVQIAAGSQVAVVTRMRLITDNAAVDLNQARLLGSFCGDLFETATSSVGSNGVNPGFGEPRHKVLGPNWTHVGYVTGTEAQIRAYPTMPFLV